MIQIPAQLLRQYTIFLTHQGVVQQEHRYYVKWIRFYFDFCHKYNFRQCSDAGPSAFMDKLTEKKQSKKQIRQAHHAVTLYCASLTQAAGKLTTKPAQGLTGTTSLSAHNRTGPICQENKQLQDFATCTHEPVIAEKKGLTGPEYIKICRMLLKSGIIRPQP